MTIKDFGTITTNIVLNNTEDLNHKFTATPNASNIRLDFGTRNNAFIFHNKSFRYNMENPLGDIKTDEVARYEKINDAWYKTIITEGQTIQYVNMTNVALYNDNPNAITLNNPAPDIVWIKNTSTRADHMLTINTYPTFRKQELTIVIANPANANGIRVNFGTGAAKVKGRIMYQSTDDTGAASTGAEHTHESADGNQFVLLEDAVIGINKYITLPKETSFTLIGQKKPVETGVTSYFWIIDQNIATSALT
jgi:hypothetical protein